MLSKSHIGLDIISRVFLNHLYYLRHHFLLILLRIIIANSFVREMTSNRMTFREIRVKPYFYPSISVNTDEVFGWSEVSNKMEQFLEAIK